MVHPRSAFYQAHLGSFSRILQRYDEIHGMNPDTRATYDYLIAQNDRDLAIQFFIEDVATDLIKFQKFRQIVLTETSQSNTLIDEIEQGLVGNTLALPLRRHVSGRQPYVACIPNELERNLAGLEPLKPESPSEMEKENPKYFNRKETLTYAQPFEDRTETLTYAQPFEEGTQTLTYAQPFEDEDDEPFFSEMTEEQQRLESNSSSDDEHIPEGEPNPMEDFY